LSNSLEPTQLEANDYGELAAKFDMIENLKVQGRPLLQWWKSVEVKAPAKHQPSIQESLSQLRAADLDLTAVQTEFLNSAKGLASRPDSESGVQLSPLKRRATSAAAKWTAAAGAAEQKKVALQGQAVEYLNRVLARHAETGEQLKSNIEALEGQTQEADQAFGQKQKQVVAAQSNRWAPQTARNVVQETAANEALENAAKEQDVALERAQGFKKGLEDLMDFYRRYQDNPEMKLLLSRAEAIRALPSLSGADVSQAMVIGDQLNDLIDYAAKELDERVRSANLSPLLSDTPRRTPDIQFAQQRAMYAMQPTGPPGSPNVAVTEAYYPPITSPPYASPESYAPYAPYAPQASYAVQPPYASPVTYAQPVSPYIAPVQYAPQWPAPSIIPTSVYYAPPAYPEIPPGMVAPLYTRPRYGY
jgi:hypothetical protein